MSRARIPFVLLGVLGLLSAGAAAFAVSSAPRTWYFSVPPTQPAAAKQLDAAIRHTMAAPGFTWRIPGDSDSLGETLVYEAPDLIRDDLGSGPPIESFGRGIHYYFQGIDLGTNNENGWYELRPTPRGYVSAARYAMKFLTQLEGANSVERHGDSFDAQILITDDPDVVGQAEETFVVRLQRGFVASEGITSRGQYFFGSKIVTEAFRFSVIYGAFGSSTVTIPAYAKVLRGGSPSCGPQVSGISFCPA